MEDQVASGAADGRRSPSGRLAGRRAIVTGGSRGIGAEIARQLAYAGARVGVMARDADNGQRVVDDIRSAGHEAVFAPADLKDATQIERAVSRLVDALGGLSILVNNAALVPSALGGASGSAIEIPLDVWNDYLTTNITGPMLVTRHAAPHILESGGGSIVNINSVAAHYAAANDIGYVTTKAALGGLTRAMAVDFAPSIRVNEVMAGFVPNDDNPRHQEKLRDPASRQAIIDATLTDRWGTAGDVAHACVYLASDEASFITAQTITIDGGAQSVLRAPGSSTMYQPLTTG